MTLQPENMPLKSKVSSITKKRHASFDPNLIIKLFYWEITFELWQQGATFSYLRFMDSEQRATRNYSAL